MRITVLIFSAAVLAYAIKAVMGLRAGEEAEQMGLDLAEHGEDGYHAVN